MHLFNEYVYSALIYSINVNILNPVIIPYPHKYHIRTSTTPHPRTFYSISAHKSSIFTHVPLHIRTRNYLYPHTHYSISAHLSHYTHIERCFSCRHLNTRNFEIWTLLLCRQLKRLSSRVVILNDI